MTRAHICLPAVPIIICLILRRSKLFDDLCIYAMLRRKTVCRVRQGFLDVQLAVTVNQVTARGTRRAAW